MKQLHFVLASLLLTFINAAAASDRPSVVRKADIDAYNGQEVILKGTYRRLSLPLSARPDAKLAPTNKAEIVLEDGTAVFLYPLWDERSRRSDAELKKNEGKKVTIPGRIAREQGNDPDFPQAARIVGPSLTPDNDDLGETPLPVLRSKKDLPIHIGKKAKLIGRFQSDPDAPPPGTTYKRAYLRLEDGFLVYLFDPLTKESLRSPEEHKKFGNKTLEIVGAVQSQNADFFIAPDNWPPSSRRFDIP